MKYLIAGGTGQLGTELTNLMKVTGRSYISLGSEDMDILDKNKVRKILRAENPSVVFHCAAYTAVDKAEEEKELNWKVNVEGTKNVAEICKELGCIFVYISTDYVYNGESSKEYKENDLLNPINEYGKAKLAGEKEVQKLLDKYYIIRTSWVFGKYGANFFYTMKKLAQSHKQLNVVSDQLGRPTETKTLANFMVHLVESKQDFGVYNLSNEGRCSWYEFAQEILKDEQVEVKPILSKDYPQKARRPKNSVMCIEKAKNTGFNIPHWKEALNELKNSIVS